MGNHEWTVQNNSQHWVHKTQYEDKQIYMKNIFMWRKKSKKYFYLNEYLTDKGQQPLFAASYTYFLHFPFKKQGIAH